MSEKAVKDERFQTEMLGMMKTVILKIDGLDNRLSNFENDVSTHKCDVSEINAKVSDNSQKLDILTDQFSDVVSLVIKNDGR